MKAYRAALLYFNPNSEDVTEVIYEVDGFLLVDKNRQGQEVVRAIGSWQELSPKYPEISATFFPGKIIAPGFVDMHLHYPQINVMGSPADGLLPWLEKYTFPEEMRFFDPGYCNEVAKFFISQLLRNGVTTALTFATSHVASVDSLMEEARANQLRMITGLCLMDRNSPSGLLNNRVRGSIKNGTEQSLIDSESLIKKWHDQDRLGYAITPRFAPTSSVEQLKGAGELAHQYPNVWIQSHVAENKEEVQWVKSLFPSSRSYLSIYNDFGLMRDRAIYAHCIHLDDEDRALMRDTGSAAAVCPTSNLFLGSGFFDYAKADKSGMSYGLASDIGGGTTMNPFQTMLAAYQIGREGAVKEGVCLSPENLWWQHTLGGARALGLDGRDGRPGVGNLQVGFEADFIVLNPDATPLLSRRTAQAESVSELLMAMIVLGDDRLIEKTVVSKGNLLS